MNLDIVKAYNQINLVINRLNSIRRDVDNEFEKLYQEVSTMTNEFGISPELPRRVGTQKYRSNIKTESPKEYYRATLFIPYLDEIISSLKDRFTCQENIIKSLYNVVPINVVNFSCNDFEDLIFFYKNDLNGPHQIILAELSLWIEFWKDKEEKPSNPLDTIGICDENLFPNIFILLKILIVIPVTTASAERSFSTLRRTKTYLRNTMCEERLSSLALISIYRKEVIIDKIIEMFLASNRKLDF